MNRYNGKRKQEWEQQNGENGETTKTKVEWYDEAEAGENDEEVKGRRG